MIWMDKLTGELYEIRLTSVGDDTYDHGEYKSYEIGGVVVMGHELLNTLDNLEFLGWL